MAVQDAEEAPLLEEGVNGPSAGLRSMQHRDYLSHSPVTALGASRPWFEDVPDDEHAIAVTVRGLIMHMDRVPGDVGPRRRHEEPRLRTVAEIGDRLMRLDPAPPTSTRPRSARLVGNCRQSTVLACALLREREIPARARCGFAAYYADGRDFYGDHWVVELWDGAQQAWRLVDTELDEQTIDAHQITFDAHNVPRVELHLAGQAWMDCRSGNQRPEMFGLHPGRVGLDYVQSQLLRDAACLIRQEPGPFDDWAAATIAPDRLAALDELADATMTLGSAGRRVRALLVANPWMAPHQP